MLSRYNGSCPTELSIIFFLRFYLHKLNFEAGIFSITFPYLDRICIYDTCASFYLPKAYIHVKCVSVPATAALLNMCIYLSEHRLLIIFPICISQFL